MSRLVDLGTMADRLTDFFFKKKKINKKSGKHFVLPKADLERPPMLLDSPNKWYQKLSGKYALP